MAQYDETGMGFIIPSKVEEHKEIEFSLKNKLVVFQPRDTSYEGIVKWYGKINNFLALGIETDHVKMGTNGIFNKLKIFECEDECGVLVKESIKILEIDKMYGYVNNKYTQNFKNDEEFVSNDLVVVKFNGLLRIGRIRASGTINEIICCQIETMDDSKINIFAKRYICEFTDSVGIVHSYSKAKYNTLKCDDVYQCKIENKVYFKYKNKKEKGLLKWKGKIDSLRCIGVEPENSELLSDFMKSFPDESDLYWIVICLDISEEKGNFIDYQISDPKELNVFTYFRIKTMVQVSRGNGFVESYIKSHEKGFIYEIKLEDNDEIIYAEYNDVKCAGLVTIKEAFEKIDNPLQYGIITIFKYDDYVRIQPNSKNELDTECYGNIVWMGFDREFSLKFLLRLEESIINGNNGIIFGQKLCVLKHKCGLLVTPDCLVPFEYTTEVTHNKVSEKVLQYQTPRFKITCGYDKGIQGDRNSCYMDTSLFAMFTFQELFDNLFYDFLHLNNTDRNEELREILRSNIIYPLRRDEYVSFDKVSEFREKLGSLFPNKKFLHSEKDPEELLETLFHLLTPKDPLLRTFHVQTKNKQNCFLTQLFYINKNNSSKITSISDMLDRTFLEGGILINKPPKCLILQLPRHGTVFKQYSEVLITSKLNISHLIRYGSQKCSQCTKTFSFFCQKCSEDNQKFIYLCSNHQQHCTHEKIDLKKENAFKGKVELELFAILCIEKTHYVAYVKTGEVLGKWIYYDSMATSDKHVLKPLIRETSIGKYFEKNIEDDSNAEDVLKIKKFAFVCFYKNPALEYYYQDFNHIK